MILYKVSQSTKKVNQWEAYAVDDSVYTAYGELGGKIIESSYTAKAKNIGRSNATTPEAQAALEVEAMIKAQKDNKHYCETIDEAISNSEVSYEPRKIKNYKDFGDRMSDVLYTTVKLNGSRACIIDSEMYSKIGIKEDVKVPHIKECIKKLSDLGFHNMDCEIYAHGVPLQRIRSAWTKPNKTEKDIIKLQKAAAKKKGIKYKEGEDYLGYDPLKDVSSLQICVFDIPDRTNMPYERRLGLMGELECGVVDAGLRQHFHFLYPITTESKGEREAVLNSVVSKGFEGLVHYEPNGVYEFGKRSMNTQKQKPRYDSEAYVKGIKKVAKDNTVVFLCETNEEMGSLEFASGVNAPKESCTMEAIGDWVGKWVNYQYEELSSSGKPTKPRIIGLRDCDKDGNPLN